MRQCLVEGDFGRIDKIIDELCRDYAYALHQPMARNAGLMGLAAAAIALGSTEVARYLDKILPPVLACFGDQNDQVRFYACESLYNIAKIAKGEILLYFNEIFDVLCKISADTETSVKGAAELLDRLIKDIVAERASTYVSIVNNDPRDIPPQTKTDSLTGEVLQEQYAQIPQLAFSLPKFIPLLTERIYAINPDTRMFLVSWLQVLESIPDLELISYLPTFLGGLFTFLGDSHKDVRVVAHSLVDLLLHEVQRISEIKNTVKEQQEKRKKHQQQIQIQMLEDTPTKKAEGALISERKKSLLNSLEQLSMAEKDAPADNKSIRDISTNDSTAQAEAETTAVSAVVSANGDTSVIQGIDGSEIRDGEPYYPGQDVHLDFPRIIEILINNLSSSEAEIQLVVLTWVETILEISPVDFLSFLSKLLALLLKILSDSNPRISESAQNVNQNLIDLTSKFDRSDDADGINYGSIVNTLTLHFLDSNVITKIACLDWLILIYHKVPNQLLEHSDSTFLTLLKSLSDKDTRVIAKALQLLSDLCNDSNEAYFKRFITDLLTLFRKDRKLVKTRANYILRQLCVKLSPERIYKVISSNLEKCEDLNFVRMMVQILSTNLVTSSELSSLRKKLRSADDWTFFTTLFKSWSYNPTSLIEMCLISENYELAYSVLQSYVDHDLSLNDLLQLDVLVQFLESPVFTRLRLQLLEQEKYPYLYKCLYGILMVLPQSKAFEILNNRLSSVSKLASQSIPSDSLYKTHNTSQSSIGMTPTTSNSSDRSLNQKKLQYKELLEHFEQVCEQGETASKSLNIYESNVSLLNEVITPQSTFQEGRPTTARSDIVNDKIEQETEDNGSVIYRGNGTSGFRRKISGRLKSLSGN